MAFRDFRKTYLTKPIFKWAQKALPSLSETERQALTVGDVWWDGELFSGNPDWEAFKAIKPARLSEEEQDFLNGPAEELCRMIDDWQINWEDKDLSPEIWEFLRKNKFFSMIIPAEYGGLGFSAYANSQVVRKIASRSIVAAVTVMVPNSLGPGELLMHFGTKAQQDYWLPRLADGREIPCFGLTSPEAGSDAAAMIDEGVVCKGKWEGKTVTGIRLNWHKRYITLGPVATVLGLAFKLKDPDQLLGEEVERGITLALVPTSLDGVEIGNRHLPCYQMFQNGPNKGRDVFIPLDLVIGGEEKIGQGWQMLMAALAAGRGISLPSLSAAGTSYAVKTTGAYARIREQFGIPIGKFEGVQERLGHMAASAYLLDAARRMTCSGLDSGHEPAVISAIMKAHATYMMRDAINDAMDIHGGKAIIDGPKNYLANLYRAIPVGITVEGANILTRSMIIFGQGSIRCHPYLLSEMQALQEHDRDKALTDFDAAFWGHVGHAVKTLGRAWLRSWSFGFIGTSPDTAPSQTKAYYKRLSRYTASFALLADMAFLTLGGSLKRKEMLSARLGDILSELYFVGATLKRWEDEGQNEEDLPLVQCAVLRSFAKIEESHDAVLRNLPNRPVSWLTRFFTLPLGVRAGGPKDDLVLACAEVLLSPSETRDRLIEGLHPGMEGDEILLLEQTFHMVVEAAPLRAKMKKAQINDYEEAVHNGVITKDDAAKLKKVDEAVSKVIAVDDFTPEELGAIENNVKIKSEKKAEEKRKSA